MRVAIELALIGSAFFAGRLYQFLRDANKVLGGGKGKRG